MSSGAVEDRRAPAAAGGGVRGGGGGAESAGAGTSSRQRFRLRGEREKLDRERAREVLEPLLREDGPLYTAVSLSGKSFGVEAAEVAEEALKRLVSRLSAAGAALLEVDFGDAIAGQRENVAHAALQKLCDALRGAKDIEYVDLSNNALGSRGLACCEALLSGKKSLRRLYVNNNGLNEDAARLLKQFVAGTSSLEVLHFHSNLLESGGAVQLGHVVEASPKLEELVLSSTRIGRVGAMAVGQALRSTQKLVYLDLCDNTFGEEGGEMLASALHTQPSLRVLNLRDTSIGDKGSTQLLRTLADTAPQLEVLDLAANEMTESSAAALADCIRGKSQLCSLLLEENTLGARGVERIAEALSPETHPKLELLSVASSNIGRRGAITLARRVAALPRLRQLCVEGNGLPESTIQALQKLFGERLSLGEDDDDDNDEGGAAASAEGDNDGADADDGRDLDAMEAELAQLSVALAERPPSSPESFSTATSGRPREDPTGSTSGLKALFQSVARVVGPQRAARSDSSSLRSSEPTAKGQRPEGAADRRSAPSASSSTSSTQQSATKRGTDLLSVRQELAAQKKEAAPSQAASSGAAAGGGVTATSAGDDVVEYGSGEQRTSAGVREISASSDDKVDAATAPLLRADCIHPDTGGLVLNTSRARLVATVSNVMIGIFLLSLVLSVFRSVDNVFYPQRM